jgi:hypothetical protein
VWPYVFKLAKSIPARYRLWGRDIVFTDESETCRGRLQVVDSLTHVSLGTEDKCSDSVVGFVPRLIVIVGCFSLVLYLIVFLLGLGLFCVGISSVRAIAASRRLLLVVVLVSTASSVLLAELQPDQELFFRQ